MAKQPQWRKLVNVQDVGDILALVNSVRDLLARKERALGRDLRKSHVLDNVSEIGARLTKLIARKRRELAHTGEETVSRVEHEVLRTAQTVEKTMEQEIQKRESVRQDNGEVGLFVVGAIAGTVIGAIMAIWFAPQSGEATRHDLEQAANDARQKIEGESLSDAIQAGKAEARRFQETAHIR